MSLKRAVHVVDDDPMVLASTARLLAAHDYVVATYPTAEAFLANSAAATGCVVLDVRLPGLDGPALQDRLRTLRPALAIVFITGHGGVELSVRAMKKGAVSFLQKPFRPDAMLEAVEEALQLSQDRQDRAARKAELDRLFARLTKREAQVLALVLQEKLNKQIAFELGVAEKTVKVHRARAIKKIEASSLIDAVRLSAERQALSSEPGA